jgi:hypothetical protein
VQEHAVSQALRNLRPQNNRLYLKSRDYLPPPAPPVVPPVVEPPELLPVLEFPEELPVWLDPLPPPRRPVFEELPLDDDPLVSPFAPAWPVWLGVVAS